MALAQDHTANKQWGQDSDPRHLVPESPRLSAGDVWETLNPPHTIIAAPFFPLGPISVVSRAYNLLKGLPSMSDWKTKYVSSELLNAKCKIKF